MGSMVELIANSRRSYAKGGQLLPVPLTRLTCASMGDPPTQAGSLGLVSCGAIALFPLGPGVCRILFVLSKESVCPHPVEVL